MLGRQRFRRTGVAALLALMLVCGASPAAAQSPFQPLPPPALPPDTTTAVQTSTSQTGGGLSTPAQVLVFVGAGAVLALIAWVILRDARAHAPRRGSVGAAADRKTATPRELKQQRERARAKRARRARKRNR
ncbi:MAG: hypothetical protein ACR2ND_09205 [Solirubrobacteraceae bacterium]